MSITPTLYGLPVVTVPSESIDKPCFTLAKNVPVTPEYRRDFNLWARKFFGVERVVMRGPHPITGRETLIMSEETLVEIEQQMRQRGNWIPHAGGSK